MKVVGMDLLSLFEQEMNRITQLELEAKQEAPGEFFGDLLFKIELIARDWAFSQVRGDITMQEYTELIGRKYDLISTIKDR